MSVSLSCSSSQLTICKVRSHRPPSETHYINSAADKKSATAITCPQPCQPLSILTAMPPRSKLQSRNPSFSSGQNGTHHLVQEALSTPCSMHWQRKPRMSNFTGSRLRLLWKLVTRSVLREFWGEILQIELFRDRLPFQLLAVCCHCSPHNHLR